MKYLNSSLSSGVVGVLSLGVFVFSKSRWINAIQGDIAIFLALMLVMVGLPYYMDISKTTTKVQKYVIVGLLFLFSVTILGYNLILWTIFVIFFLLQYICLWFVRNPDVSKDEMPYQYFFRKKQYFKRTLLVMIPYIITYWTVIWAINSNVLPLYKITLGN